MDFTKDDLIDAIKRGFGTTDFSPENMQAFVKSMKSYTEEIKRSQSSMKTFKNIVDGQTNPLKDVTDQLEKLDQAIAETTKATKAELDADKKLAYQENKAKLEAEKANLQSAVASTNVKIAFGNLGASLVNFTGGLKDAVSEFATGLQSGKAGTELYADATIKAAKSSGELISSIGQMVSVGAALVSLLPGVGKVVRYIMLALSAAGTGAELFGKQASQLASEGLVYLRDEIKNAKDAFKEATGAGALFAVGMTEMRQQAAIAGLNMQQLGQVIKDNKESLSQMGGGLGEAVKQIAKVSGVLRGGKLGEQLQLLGYSFEEQAGLAADVTAQLRIAGDQRIHDEKYVAGVTAQYGKDLKVLADLTGKDAKKAMAEARLTATTQQAIAALADTPGAILKFQRQIATMKLQGVDSNLIEGYVQMVATKGAAATNVTFNIAQNQNRAFSEATKNMQKSLYDQTVTVSQVQDSTTQSLIKAGKAQIEIAKQNPAQAISASLGNNQVLKSVSSAQDTLVQLGLALDPEAVGRVRTNVDAAATNSATFDRTIRELDAAAQAARVAMMNNLTTPMVDFAEHMKSNAELLNESAELLVKAKTALGNLGLGGYESFRTNSAKKESGIPESQQVLRGLDSLTDGALSRIYNNGNIFGKSETRDKSENGYKTKSAESTAGGPTSPELEKIASIITSQYSGTVVTAYDDAWHRKNRPNSPHTRGAAADLTVPDLNQEKLNTINQLIAGLGKASIHANAQGNGQHLHIEKTTETESSKTPVKKDKSSTETESLSLFKMMEKQFIGMTNVLSTIARNTDKTAKAVQ